jgi:hypothetical protein
MQRQQQQEDAGTETERGHDTKLEAPDFPPQQKRGWWGKLESKLKQALCFQDSQKKIMYRQHVKEKEARACQISMMCHLGMPNVHSGSEKTITTEE